METIRGRTSRVLDVYEWKDQLANYNRILLDLGTGDGRYVHSLAGRHPDWFIIGVDACRENLHKYSQAQLPNMLFVIASAQALPCELHGLVSHITINFPWGSLLDSLLTGDPALLGGLRSISTAAACIDLHLNGGALAEAGPTLTAGAEAIRTHLLRAGWQMDSPALWQAAALRTFPSTWAKRLAFGRDPRAMALTGSLRA